MSDVVASQGAVVSAQAEPTVIREMLFGAIGGVIAIGCVLPPLLHFVSGPLGPCIGGFIAAQLVKPQARGRAIIAVMIGSVLAGLFAVLAFAIATFSGDGGPPSWFPDNGTLLLIVAGVWLYGAVLGAIGVTVQGMFEAKAGNKNVAT